MWEAEQFVVINSELISWKNINLICKFKNICYILLVLSKKKIILNDDKIKWKAEQFVVTVSQLVGKTLVGR